MWNDDKTAIEEIYWGNFPVNLDERELRLVLEFNNSDEKLEIQTGHYT